VRLRAIHPTSPIFASSPGISVRLGQAFPITRFLILAGDLNIPLAATDGAVLAPISAPTLTGFCRCRKPVVRQLRHPCPGDPSGGAHPVNRPWNAGEGVSRGQSIDVLRKWSARRRVPWDSEGRAADDIWRTSGNARPCFWPARRRWRRIGSGAECCEYRHERP
jgi:hypothetical protein